MTNDQLLDVIGHWNWVDGGPLVDALRKIAYLHEPDKDGDCSSCFVNVSFDAAPVEYPCPTIQIIERELSNV